MDKSFCPVCKEPVDNYYLEPITCKICDTDLSAYYLVHKINSEWKEKLEKNNLKKTTKYKAAIILFPFVCLIICISNYHLFPKEIVKEVIKRSVVIDTVFIPTIKTPTDQPSIVKYIVIKGDNLAKISSLFYGNDDHVGNIIKDNKLLNPDNILPGDFLYINLSKKK